MDPEKIPQAVAIGALMFVTADVFVRRERSLFAALMRTLGWA